MFFHLGGTRTPFDPRDAESALRKLRHEVMVGRQDFFDALPKLIWHEDEPIVWPSSVALYFVAKLARERVTVVLTGEGSDETLAGYSRYAFTLKNVAFDRMYRGVVPSGVRRGLRTAIAGSSLINANLRRKLSHTFLGLDGESWSSFYFDNFFSAFNEHATDRRFVNATPRFTGDHTCDSAHNLVLYHFSRD